MHGLLILMASVHILTSEVSRMTLAKENGTVVSLTEQRARKMIAQGLDRAARGRVDEAIELFNKSADLYPTSEAYTYWGWMLGFLGYLDDAIELCKKAISIDGDFGNPYNDIGTYFMKKGELGAAIPWLEKAKNAKRYEPKHFPYMNLGRIYLHQCDFARALAEFEVALQLNPSDEELRMVVSRIRARQKVTERPSPRLMV